MFTSLAFQRPIGCRADVKELEYVSALHQTDACVRKDMSIKDVDIRLFLKSRYGINVTDEDVRNTILQGLGGGDSDTQVLDAMEVMAMLIIPTLRKASEIQFGYKLPEGLVKPPDDLFKTVLNMILQDVTGEKDNTDAVELTADLIKRILIFYGELDLASDDELVQEMLEAATSNDQGRSSNSSSNNNTDVEEGFTGAPATASTRGAQILNAESFATALTYDVELYDIKSEGRLNTHFDDVFLSHHTGDIKYSQSGVHGKSVSFKTGGGGNEAKSSTLVDMQMTTDELRERLSIVSNVDRQFTASAVDLAAGTYRSKYLMVCLWACVLVTYFAYNTGGGSRELASLICTESGIQYSYDSPWKHNSDAMFCESFISVIVWLLMFLALAVYGVFFVGLGSIGNAVDCKHWTRPLFGAFIVGIFTIPPFMSSNGRGGDRYVESISLILGFVVISFHLSHVFSLILPQYLYEKIPVVRRLFDASSIRFERDAKMSLALKINGAVNNALEVARNHESTQFAVTNFARGLDSFTKMKKRYENVGGFLWIWKYIFNGQIYKIEGVHFSARLLASNIAQYVVCVYVLFAGLNRVADILSRYDPNKADEQVNQMVNLALMLSTGAEDVSPLVSNITGIVNSYIGNYSMNDSSNVNCENFRGVNQILNDYCFDNEGKFTCDSNVTHNDYLCALRDTSFSNATIEEALMEASGFDTTSLYDIANATLHDAAHKSVKNLYPSSKYMIAVPLYLSLIVAFLTALNLATTYVPSVTATIMKLRCGVIPTLHNRDFDMYRVAPETVALLSGSLFWGCLVSSLITGFFFGAIVFFFLWQATAYYAQRVVTMGIGIVIICLFRILLICFCRKKYYRAFYRSRPAAANLAILGLEWGTFTLSAGFIFVRIIKVLLVAGFSIGRIDRPFLADGIGRINGFELDNFPTIHLRDVLAHEAHRHPFIEQLGTMYLMKLRYSKHFGKRAGSCWRLIFVYALMPWLYIYRISARPEKLMDNLSKELQKDIIDAMEQVDNSFNDVSAAANLTSIDNRRSMFRAALQSSIRARSQFGNMQSNKGNNGDDDDDNNEGVEYTNDGNM